MAITLHPRGTLRSRFEGTEQDAVFRRLGLGARACDLGDEGLYLAEEIVAADKWFGGSDPEALGILVLALMIVQRQGSSRLPLDPSPRGQLATLVKEILHIAGYDANGSQIAKRIHTLTARPGFNSVIGVGNARLPLIVEDNCLYTERARYLEGRVALRLAERVAPFGHTVSRAPATTAAQPALFGEPAAPKSNVIAFPSAAERAALQAAAENARFLAAATAKQADAGIVDEPVVVRITAENEPKLTEEQRRAVELALRGRISVVTGGPGTGKTLVAAAIVRGFQRMGIREIALAAPTGKAANRLTEVIAKELASHPQARELAAMARSAASPSAANSASGDRESAANLAGGPAASATVRGGPANHSDAHPLASGLAVPSSVAATIVRGPAVASTTPGTPSTDHDAASEAGAPTDPSALASATDVGPNRARAEATSEAASTTDPSALASARDLGPSRAHRDSMTGSKPRGTAEPGAPSRARRDSSSGSAKARAAAASAKFQERVLADLLRESVGAAKDSAADAMDASTTDSTSAASAGTTSAASAGATNSASPGATSAASAGATNAASAGATNAASAGATNAASAGATTSAASAGATNATSAGTTSAASAGATSAASAGATNAASAGATNATSAGTTSAANAASAGATSTASAGAAGLTGSGASTSTDSPTRSAGQPGAGSTVVDGNQSVPLATAAASRAGEDRPGATKPPIGAAGATAPAGAPPAPDELAMPVAQTLHRLLGYRVHGFAHHARSPLPVGAVIVDEASMIDLELVDALLDALPPNAPLVLIGDAHQLPAVDAGRILADLADPEGAAAARVATLHHSHRMDAADPRGRQVLEAAQAIHRGDPAALFMAKNPLATARTPGTLAFSGVEWVDSAKGPQVARQVTSTVWHHFGGPRAQELANDTVFRFDEGTIVPEQAAELEDLWHRIGRARILTATRGMPTGARALNAHLHELALDNMTIAGKPEFVPGEPVMITANDYQRGLFNGDQGIIIRADEGTGHHRYRAVFRVNNRLVPFAIEALRDRLELAWALTIHKSQGSELEAVAIVLPDEDLPLVTRELIYTGITRARYSVVLCGSRAGITKGATRIAMRHSGLADRMRAHLAR